MLFLLRFLNLLSPLPKKVQSSHWQKSRKKRTQHPHKIFSWRKRSSPQSGDFYLKLSINLHARNIISGEMHFRFAFTNNSFRKKAQKIILNNGWPLGGSTVIFKCHASQNYFIMCALYNVIMVHAWPNQHTVLSIIMKLIQLTGAWPIQLEVMPKSQFPFTHSVGLSNNRNQISKGLIIFIGSLPLKLSQHRYCPWDINLTSAKFHFFHQTILIKPRTLFWAEINE